jgi:hypothetical protein
MGLVLRELPTELVGLLKLSEDELVPVSDDLVSLVILVKDLTVDDPVAVALDVTAETPALPTTENWFV